MADQSFEVQIAVLREQFRALEQLLEGAKFIAQLTNDNAKTLAVHEDRFSEIRRDFGELEGRWSKTAERIEKSCNDLGGQLRSTESAIKDEMDRRIQANATAKINGRYLLYAAFLTGVIGIIVKLLGIVG